MKYAIKRAGDTVCIGHCKDFGEIIHSGSYRMKVDEIRRRLKAGKFADGGVTFKARGFAAFTPGDIIELTSETEITTLQIIEGGEHREIGQRPRRITESA